MHFDADAKPAKATLKIGEKTYNFRAPTRAESEAYTETYESIKGESKKISKLMDEYMSKLGNIPVDELRKVESDMFYDLWTYLVTPAKKN